MINNCGRRTTGRVSVLAILVVSVLTAFIAVPSPVSYGEISAVALPEMIDERTAKAIDSALKYLADTQRSDGSWSSSGGYSYYPATMTALAGLALLAGGSTPETGRYSRNVSKAMNSLLRIAGSRSDGLICGPNEGQPMYGHGFAMLFLAQCYGMELHEDTEKRLRRVLTEGAKLTARSQSKMTSRFGKPCGGWYYSPSSNSDEGSVTVTQLQALRACRNVGIKVPPDTINKAVEYLRHCQNKDGGICYSARSRGGSRVPISAAAVTCFYAAGVYDRDAGGKGGEAEMVSKLIAYCDKNVNNRSGFPYYTDFYVAQAKYQQGAKAWNRYFPGVRSKLLFSQSADGSWSSNYGTTYGTAMSAIILQLPYGYLPVVQR